MLRSSAFDCKARPLLTLHDVRIGSRSVFVRKDANRPEAVVRCRLSVLSGSPQYAPCTRLRGVPATKASMLSISWSASACWASSAAHAMCGVMAAANLEPQLWRLLR